MFLGNLNGMKRFRVPICSYYFIIVNSRCNSWRVFFIYFYFFICNSWRVFIFVLCNNWNLFLQNVLLMNKNFIFWTLYFNSWLCLLKNSLILKSVQNQKIRQLFSCVTPPPPLFPLSPFVWPKFQLIPLLLFLGSFNWLRD